MLPALIIVAFLSLYVRDLLGGAMLAGAMSAGTAAGAAVLGFATIGASAQAVMGWCARRAGSTGDIGAVRLSDRAGGAARLAGGVWLAACVVGLGWVEAVRSVVGDVVFADEALVIAPFLALVLWVWWAGYPLHAQLRDAVLLRALDQGVPVHPPYTRAGYVGANARHQLLILLVPLSLISAWTELIERAAASMARRGGGSWRVALDRWATGVFGVGTSDPAALQVIAGVLTIVGVAGVLFATPVILKSAWDTAPLGPGAMRDRLEGLLRGGGVGMRRVLVWRTRGTLVNGAVIGILPPWRYILLTDGLLERLGEDQVAAVSAHEVGHVRHRHTAWLAACVVAAAMPMAMLAAWVLPMVLGAGASAPTVTVLGLVLALGAVVVVFGWVSRLMERQADAFAVKHLSRERPDAGPEGGEPGGGNGGGSGGFVTPGAARAMIDALCEVGELNGMNMHAFTWRHGSIATRIAALRGLVGMPIDRLPIDARVRRVKRAAAAVLAACAVWFMLAGARII